MALALKKNMRDTHPIFVKGIIVSIICIFIFFAGRSMVSSVLTIRPETTILEWEQKNESLNLDLASTLLVRLKNSVAIDPSNANHHALVARLYELLAFYDTTLTNSAYISSANRFYKQAILHQPSGYMAWARLAALNSKIGNDKLAIIALEKAISLGTYENQNQRIVIPIIIKYWHSAYFVGDNSTNINDLFSHTLKFRINHTWLLNRVLQSKDISLLRFTLPLIQHQEQLDKFDKYLSDRPQLKLRFMQQYDE